MEQAQSPKHLRKTVRSAVFCVMVKNGLSFPVRIEDNTPENQERRDTLLNMKQWLQQLPGSGKPLPLLSFPGMRFLGDVNVRQMVTDSRIQADCMKAVADRVEAAAAVSFMDLSVEAEAFGAVIRDTQFGAEVELEILVAEGDTQAFLDKLTDMTAGTVEGMEIGQEYRAFPVDEKA